MPDGTVMKGAQHERAAHAHHDHSQHAHVTAQAKPAPAGNPGQVEYTCPMHPQVRQMGPGSCPLCGMALEPVLATAEPGESPELREMTKRFWIGTALTVPVFALEMGGHLTNLSHVLGQQMSNWIQLLLGTPVVLWAGWPFFVRAVASVKHRSLNMYSLIALGTGAAWLYSIVGTVAPGLFPANLRMADGAVAVYFEAAAVITVLVLLGQVLELRAREKTSGAIKALLGLAPKTALKVGADGSEAAVQVDAIEVGDLLRVRPGEKVPVDGELIDGKGNVDEAMVTGEPIPTGKQPGDDVIGGSVNQAGTLVVEVTKVGEDSFLAQVTRYVEEARALKPGILALNDAILAVFVPAVLVAGFGALVLWSLIPWATTGHPDAARGLFAMLAVAVMGYPCALGMATPLAMIRGGGRAA
ncbi:MAG: HAD-IC family P-type ATPase, partial [Burkholderiales bacterium]|nr:HAD-IC family P-type ATPase [Burkholderiales bacterium]